MSTFTVDVREWPAAFSQHRVAIVTGSYDTQVDGVALTLNRLAAHLLRQGHEVMVICPGKGNSAIIKPASEDITRVPSLPLPIWKEYHLTFGLGRRAANRLESFAPTMMHIAVPDALGHAAQRWGRRHGVPVLCSHHTRWNQYLGYYSLAFLEGLLWWGMRRFHARCDATLVPSVAVAAELEAQRVRAVHTWPRGVDTALFSPTRRSLAWRRDLGLGDSEIVVLIVSRLRWEKGLREYVRAMALLEASSSSQLRAVVVGEGPAKEGMRRGLPNALFLGRLTGRALAVAYASSDVFLYPSTTEGWGATCLEAQASALPVVATAASGITDVVAHGETGFLLPPHNTSAMAQAVESLAVDPALRARMGRAAVAHARRFSWEASGDLVLRHYARLAAYSSTRTPTAAADAQLRARPSAAWRVLPRPIWTALLHRWR